MKRKIILIIFVFLFNMLWVNAINVTNSLSDKYNIKIKTTSESSVNTTPSVLEELDVVLDDNSAYNNEDNKIIASKINLYLKEEMAEYGSLISKYSIANGVNPYLTASIIIESTGCDNKCSVLLTKCNNVYEAKYNKDMVQQSACFGGNYQKFSSIDDSIKSLVKYLKNNFYEKELTTPNSIYKTYGKNVGWAFRVNQYMDKIKSSSLN